MTQPLHPAQLHAHAALHSLRVALALLDDRTAAERAAIRAEQAAAADPLHSPLWGRRHALGGHGDPTADAVDTIGTPRPNRWAELQREVLAQLAGVAQHLPPTSGFDPLARFEAALPTVSFTAATATWKLLDRIDTRIRRLLHEPDDRQLIPRLCCPACGLSGMLAIRTSAPRPDRVAVCTAASCMCAGEDCPCGMAVRAANARHVWPIDALRKDESAITITAGRSAA